MDTSLAYICEFIHAWSGICWLETDICVHRLELKDEMKGGYHPSRSFESLFSWFYWKNPGRIYSFCGSFSIPVHWMNYIRSFVRSCFIITKQLAVLSRSTIHSSSWKSIQLNLFVWKRLFSSVLVSERRSFSSLSFLFPLKKVDHYNRRTSSSICKIKPNWP